MTSLILHSSSITGALSFDSRYLFVGFGPSTAQQIAPQGLLVDTLHSKLSQTTFLIHTFLLPRFNSPANYFYSLENTQELEDEFVDISPIKQLSLGEVRMFELCTEG